MKLPIVYPFITHKPPEAYVFSILGAYPQTQSWLISNYINVYINENGKGDFWGKDFFYQNCPWLFENHIPREIIKASIHDFVSFCCLCLDKEYYLSFMVNEKYIQAYDCNIDKDHNILVFGYEESEHLFHIADFFSHGKYQFATCSYKELTNAFYSDLIDHTDYFEAIRLIRLKKIDYVFEKMEIREHLEEQLASTNLFVKYKRVPYEENLLLDENGKGYYMSENMLRSQYHFGLKYYEKLIEIYANQFSFDIRPIHLLYDRMCLMKRRVCILEETRWMQHNEALNEVIENSISLVQTIRNYILKHRISHTRNPSADIVIDGLEKSFKYDKTICEMLLDGLDFNNQ